MSNTPRTDAATVEVDVAFIGHDGLSSSPQRYVEVEFAQQLERELAALVRDARRFRRMERAHDGPTNTAWCKAAHYRDGLFKQWDVVITPLAEIADALPEVEL